MAKSDLDGLEQTLKSLFASSRLYNFTNNYIETMRDFTLQFSMPIFAGAGFDKIIAEDATNSGRSELVCSIDY